MRWGWLVLLATACEEPLPPELECEPFALECRDDGHDVVALCCEGTECWWSTYGGGKYPCRVDDCGDLITEMWTNVCINGV